MLGLVVAALDAAAASLVGMPLVAASRLDEPPFAQLAIGFALRAAPHCAQARMGCRKSLRRLPVHSCSWRTAPQCRSPRVAPTFAGCVPAIGRFRRRAAFGKVAPPNSRKPRHDCFDPFPVRCGARRDCFISGGGQTVIASMSESGNCAASLSADARILALGDNGGSTRTHALGLDSPAIDTGDATFCLDDDQRGVARPQDAGCDPGALEVDTIGILADGFEDGG